MSSPNAVCKSSLLPFFVRSNKLFNYQRKNKKSLWKNQAIFQCIFHSENRMVPFFGLRLFINRDPFFHFNRPKFVNVFLSRKSNGKNLILNVYCTNKIFFRIFRTSVSCVFFPRSEMVYFVLAVYIKINSLFRFLKAENRPNFKSVIFNSKV